MKKNELKKHLTKIAATHKELDELCDKLHDLGVIPYGSKAFETIWKPYEAAVDALSAAIGDPCWINWFLVDNDFGKSGLTASWTDRKGRKKRAQITTIDQLVEIIHDTRKER